MAEAAATSTDFWGQILTGIAQLGGAYLSAQGAKKAASTAAAGSDAAAAEAARQFDIARGDVLGRINIGNQAINALGSIYGYSPTTSSPYQVGASAPAGTAYQPAPAAPNNRFSGAASGALTGAQYGGWPGAIIGGVVGYGLNGGVSDANPLKASGFTGISMDQAWQDQNLARLASNPAASVASKLGVSSSSILGKALDPSGWFGNKHGDEKRNLKAFAAESGVMQLQNGMLMLPDGSTFSPDQLQNVAGTWYGAVHAPDGNQQDWQNRYNSLLGGLQKTPLPNTGNAGGGLTSDGVPNSAPLSPGGANPLAAPDYSAFIKSPDYQFRKDQGMQGIENSFSASGGAKSGNALKALADFNSNLASGEFGNYFNRQLALAGQGQAATGQSASSGVATGQIVGNALQNAGDARASGVAGQYNALGQGLSGLSQGLGYYMQQRQNPYGYDPSGIGYFSPTQRRVG